MMMAIRDIKTTADSSVVVKKGRETETIENPELRESICRAMELSGQEKLARANLSPIKAYIAEVAKQYTEGTVTFKVGKISCKVSFGQEASIPEANIELIQQLLPDSNVKDLIRTKTSHAPEKRLTELATKNPALAELIVVTDRAPSITLTMEK